MNLHEICLQLEFDGRLHESVRKQANEFGKSVANLADRFAAHANYEPLDLHNADVMVLSREATMKRAEGIALLRELAALAQTRLDIVTASRDATADELRVAETELPKVLKAAESHLAKAGFDRTTGVEPAKNLPLDYASRQIDAFIGKSKFVRELRTKILALKNELTGCHELVTDSRRTLAEVESTLRIELESCRVI